MWVDALYKIVTCFDTDRNKCLFLERYNIQILATSYSTIIAYFGKNDILITVSNRKSHLWVKLYKRYDTFVQCMTPNNALCILKNYYNVLFLSV